jgi:glycosyltransferase involved in cell wall biosynthesis
LIPRLGVVALAAPENGGVFQYTQAVIDALAGRKDFEVVVFTAHDKFDAHGLEQHTISFARLGWREKLTMGASVLAGRGSPLFVPAADRRRFESVDGFFIPSVLPYPQLFFDKPYVAAIHDLQERHFPQFFAAAERFQRNATNRTVARRARRVICESAYVKKDITQFLGVDAARVAVVPAPPPASIMGAPPSPSEVAATRQKHDLMRDYIFYPAQCWPHKNHTSLLQALVRLRAQHPELQLVLTGSQQYEYATVMREAAARGLAGDVRHLGYLPYDELRSVFKGARALVVPTLFESISIPVYEAFALGVPVCVSRVVGLPEQVGDAALLFEPHDPVAIAAAVEKLLGDATLGETLVARGKAKLDELARQPYADRLAAVVRDALVDGDGGRA